MTRWEAGQILIDCNDHLCEKRNELKDNGFPDLAEKLDAIKLQIGDLFNGFGSHEFGLPGTGIANADIPTKLWAIKWDESERGWGRSAHSIEVFQTEEMAEKKIEAELSGRTIEEVPDWYLTPSRPVLVSVSPDLARAVLEDGSKAIGPECDPATWANLKTDETQVAP